jgi:HSP20 family protein
MLEKFAKNDRDVIRNRDDIKDKEQQLDTQQRQEQDRYPSRISQMERMFDEVFRRPFFSSLSQRGSEFEEPFLPVDIFEDNESVILKAELPGIKRENIDVQLTPDSVTISGQKSSEEKIERNDFFRHERSYGSFTRRFQLPVETLTEGARASFKDGVLEVRIPKSVSPSQRARTLTIE